MELVKNSRSETFGITPYLSLNLRMAVKHRFSAIYLDYLFIVLLARGHSFAFATLLALSAFDSLYTFTVTLLE